MPVTDVQVAALRAFLIQDVAIAARLARDLGNDQDPGYVYLALAALSVVARQHFHPTFTDADLIRYVAKVRLDRVGDSDEYDFDPAAGENVLRYALGHDIRQGADPRDQFRIVIALLDALTGDGQADQAEVGMLLAQARMVADRWMAGQLLCSGRGDRLPALARISCPPPRRFG
jgi:small ligand-binding sensory domain FIST